jgi:hypothetical protein
MIDLKVGDVYYKANGTLNTFHRKKETRVIDGEEWFRYEKPRITYELNSYKILGVLCKKLEGEWDANEEYELITQWHVRCIETNHVFVTDADIADDYGFFLDKDAAMAYIEQKMDEDREKDRE